jgi:hypothetical protein
MGDEGLMQIFVPGRGKGYVNIQKKEKGKVVPDMEAEMKAQAEIRAWEKENGLKPKNLTPIKKPTTETEDKPSPSIGARRGTGAQSSLEALTSKVGRAKEGAGSALSSLGSYISDMRRGK